MIKNLLAISALIASVAVLYVEALPTIVKDWNEAEKRYQDEIKCMNEKVYDLGIERINIVMKDGDCYVK
jgi:hypothetical protein